MSMNRLSAHTDPRSNNPNIKTQQEKRLFRAKQTKSTTNRSVRNQTRQRHGLDMKSTG
jgi:hypothetical protein